MPPALIQALRSMGFDCAKFTCFTSTQVRTLTREEALRGKRCWRLCRRCFTSTSTKVQILTREEALRGRSCWLLCRRCATWPSTVRRTASGYPVYLLY